MEDNSQRALPGWILTGPSRAPTIEPPIDTLAQVLPFGALAWEDFERLCCSLARISTEVVDCRLYGTYGQTQKGIDILVQRRDSFEFEVYQCKREASFGPSKVVAAVDDFLSGDWASRAKKFVLCIATNASATQVEEEVIRQRARLSAAGVEFGVWDDQELSRLLKQEPEVVHDFFGRAWVERFVGADASAALQGRLDASEVVELRANLARLYEAVFRSQDPGSLSGASPQHRANTGLLERVVPLEVQLESALMDGPSSQVPSEDLGGPDDSAMRGAAEESIAFGAGAGSVPTPFRRKVSEPQSDYAPRDALDSWLAAGGCAILIGKPGAGKSSMLRFLALDLLAENPTLSLVAERWGQRLPIWLPFAYWTKLIASAPSPTSLAACIEQWLMAFDSEELIPLVRRAIQDERLLLIVDGLDEWADETSAATAFSLLQVHVETKGTTAISSARPFALDRLSMPTGSWRVGHLADLSVAQQYEIAQRWLAWTLAIDEEERPSEGFVPSKARAFIDELGTSGDLKSLARTPLLLVSLLLLWIEKSELPRHRFDAYDRLVEHLLATHPARRRAAGFGRQTQDQLDTRHARLVLAYLAYHMHAIEGGGPIDADRGVDLIRSLLASKESIGLGMDEGFAARAANAFLPTGAEQFGVLSRPSPTQIAFFHRAIQEYLAAEHLSRLPLEEQLAVYANHGCDPRWREVVLGILWLTDRPTDADALVESFRPKDALERHYIAELRSEIAFGAYRTSPPVTQEMATESIRLLELGEDLRQRTVVLSHVIGGLSDPALRPMVDAHVQRWSYRRDLWPPATYETLRLWPFDDLTSELLWCGLAQDDDSLAQRIAARSLAAVARGDEEIGNRLMGVAQRSELVGRRAAAVEALAEGWPDKSGLMDVIEASRASRDPSLAASAIASKARLGRQDQDDLIALLSLVTRDMVSNWISKPDLAQVIAEGWPNNPDLKAACFAGSRRDYHADNAIDSTIAQQTLVSGFGQDDEVAAWIDQELSTQEHPFLLALGRRGDIWRDIADNFRDHPIVVAAVDKWLPKQTFNEIEVAASALVGRTPIARAKLIDSLHTSSFPHWAAGALLEGWGTADGDVRDALREVAAAEGDRASRIGHLLPRILGSKDARVRLLALLTDPNARRRDLVIQGLAGLEERGDEDEIVTQCLATGSLSIEERDELIVGFPYHDRVRTLAESSMTGREPPIVAAAYGYRADYSMRQRIFNAISPLPASLRMSLSPLVERSRESAAMESLLGAYDVEWADEVKLIAAIGYYTNLPTAARASERDKLNDLLVSRGPDYEARRRSAFAGLLLTGNLLDVRDADEPQDASKRLRVPLNTFSPHTSFFRLIGEHWPEVVETFGPDVPSRFGWSETSSAFWAQLARVAIDFPTTHRTLLDEIERDSGLATSPACLRFVARVRPGDEELRARCLSVIRGTVDTLVSVQGQTSTEAAVDILAEQFVEDPTIVTALTEDGIDLFEQDKVACLVRIAPDHPLIETLHAEASAANRPPIPGRSFFSLRLGRDPAEEFPNMLDESFAWIRRAGPFSSRDVARAASWRLRRDGNAVSALSERLRSGNASPNLKASGARLLRQVGKLSQEDRDWCRDEIDRQENAGTSEIGLDISIQQFQGIALSLKQAIGEPFGRGS